MRCYSQPLQSRRERAVLLGARKRQSGSIASTAVVPAVAPQPCRSAPAIHRRSAHARSRVHRASGPGPSDHIGPRRAPSQWASRDRSTKTAQRPGRNSRRPSLSTARGSIAERCTASLRSQRSNISGCANRHDRAAIRQIGAKNPISIWPLQIVGYVTAGDNACDAVPNAARPRLPLARGDPLPHHPIEHSEHVSARFSTYRTLSTRSLSIIG